MTNFVRKEEVINNLQSKLGALTGYPTCAALLPFIVMLYQYQRNIQYLSLIQVLIFCLCFALLMAAGYHLIKVFLKTDIGSFLMITAGFVLFFASKAILHMNLTVTSKIPMEILNILVSVTGFAVFFFAFYILTAFASKIKPFKDAKLFNRKIPLGIKSRKPEIPVVIPFIAVIAAIICLAPYTVFLNTFNVKPRIGLLFNCLVILAGLITDLSSKLNASKKMSLVIFTILCVILLQNIAGIIIFASQQKTVDEFYKETFNVDADITEKPDIYWIHCDGMLGFDAMSGFYGDEQNELAGELEDRGFLINREAAFEANHTTQWAVPTLMSPYYYDRVMSWELDPAYAEAAPINADLLDNQRGRLKPNFSSNKAAREKNETVMAFNASSYSTNTISSLSYYFLPTVDRFYNTFSLEEPLVTTSRPMPETVGFVSRISNGVNLIELLSMMTLAPNPENPAIRPIFSKLTEMGFTVSKIEKTVDLFTELEVDEASREQFYKWNRRGDFLNDVIKQRSPKFAIYDFGMAHRPFYYDRQGDYNEEDADNPMRYPEHHDFSVKTLLKNLDMILKADSEAVIVLQSDHGLHGLTIEQITSAFNCTEEEALAIWNQVFSAIRLPKEKLTPETRGILSDPRNISRYLINNYVGKNYEYIPPKYRQKFTGQAHDLLVE